MQMRHESLKRQLSGVWRFPQDCSLRRSSRPIFSWLRFTNFEHIPHFVLVFLLLTWACKCRLGKEILDLQHYITTLYYMDPSLIFHLQYILSLSQAGSCNRMNEVPLTHFHLVSHKMLQKIFGTVWKIMEAWIRLRRLLSQESIADEIREVFGKTLKVVRFTLFNIVDWRNSVHRHYYLQEQSEAPSN